MENIKNMSIISALIYFQIKYFMLLTSENIEFYT